MLEPYTNSYRDDGTEPPVGGNGRGYLERWHDAGLVLPDYVDRSLIKQVESDRIGRALAIVRVAGSIPRRLGGDASGPELALDKKRARRVGHALEQSYERWSRRNAKVPFDDEIRIAGVHLRWEEFVSAHCTTLQSRMRFVATWSIRTEDLKWGRSALVNFENELKWVTYSFRD